MLIIKFMLFFFYIFLTNFFTGKCISKILKKENNYIENIVYGFVVNLALIQLFLWYFVAFKLSTTIFMSVMMAITIVPTIIGMYFTYKDLKNTKKYEKNNLKKVQVKDVLVRILFVTLLMFEIILTTIYYKSDDDDSFYVSNSTLFANSQYLNEYDSSMGDDSLGTVPLYDFQVWESMITVYGKIFSVEPVIIAHTFLIPILIILSSMSSIVLGKKLFKDNNKAYFFAGFLILFNLFGGYSTYTCGSRVMCRIWQGKSVYLTVVLPLVITYIVNALEKVDYTLSIDMLICVLASIGLNPTSLFIIGFETLFLLVAISIYKKNAKLLLYMIPSVIAVLSFTLFIYMRTSQFTAQIAAASTISYEGILNIYTKFFGGHSWIYLILYILSAIYILKKGNDEQKNILVFAPILMLIFIWNPITGKFVAENITKVSTYWRVFWLIPFSYGIITAILLILDKIKNLKLKYAFVCACIVVICLTGKWIVSADNSFRKVENVYKLPQDAIAFGQIISQDENNRTLVAKNGINTTIRQKYSNIKLIFSRYQYMLDLLQYRGKEEEAQERIDLQDIIDGNEEKINLLQNLLEKYRVGWIIIDKDKNNIINEILNLEYKIVETSDESYLLKLTI